MISGIKVLRNLAYYLGKQYVLTCSSGPHYVMNLD